MNKWAVLLLVVFASCVMCRSITSVYVYTADTYARVEWSVDEDSSDDGVISYYELTIKDKTTDSAATTTEKNLGTEYPFDDYVYDALVAGHEYKVTITGKVVGGDDVEESITFETYDNLDCDHLDVIAAFFSMEIYGPVQYPSYTFCGRTWETYYTTPDLTSTARDMVAYNSDLQIAVVAFRGTIVTLEDWTVNFELGFSSCEDFIFNNDCKGDIHEGFGNEYLKSRTNIRSYLSDLLTAGINRIIVTGHSQGAALATVAATDLYAFTKDQVGGGNFEVRPITMGSPRVGDGDFADDFDEKLAGESGDTERSCRYVAEGENDLGITVEDLVTQLPLNDVPGIDYKHVSKKILVDFGTEECTITGKKGNIPCHSIFNYFEEIATQNSATDFSVTTPALDLSGLRSPLLTDLVISTRPVSQQSSIFSTVFSSSSNFLSSVFGSSPSSSNAGGSNSGASQLEMSMFLFAMVFGIIALIF